MASIAGITTESPARVHVADVATRSSTVTYEVHAGRILCSSSLGGSGRDR